uniref:4-coumarate--CoA ligase 1-like n=1 Tax=Styela clava TaxID=7725 RepID=UPI00193A15EB|nr:4-coumarate--CoA ligase 1-like [Styela clava]
MPTKSKHAAFDIPEVSLNNYFLSRIKEYGSEVALIDSVTEEKQLTFKQVYEQIQSCGRYFQEQNIGEGDVVGLVLPNCVEYIIAMMGVISCGAAISPCNPLYKEGEMQHIFKITEPKMLIVSDESINNVKQVLKHYSENQVKQIIVLGKSNEFETWDEVMLSKNENIENFVPHCKISPRKTLAILPYSSGTTGLPKCVMHNHYSTISTMLCFCFTIHAMLVLISRHHSQYKRGETYYNERPMFHGGGFMFVLAVLQGGLSVVMDQEFDVERTLFAIQKYKVNHMFVVPPNLLQLSQTELHDKYDITSWKTSITGGASIPTTVMKSVIDRFNVKLIPVYAMTECCPISWKDNDDSVLDSAGSICVNSEFMIVDPNTGKELKYGREGEIWTKGPQVTVGYYKNTEATEQTIPKDGYLRTGDIGVIKDKKLYVIGRLKEVIKYKTLQVAPAEIENVLLSHPDVEDAGVVGVPDPTCGELPKAFVVRKVESLTADELQTLIKNELIDYKQLRGGIKFVNKIPKSKLGKINRLELKTWATEKDN